MNDRRADDGWRAFSLWLRERFFSMDQPLFFIFIGLAGLSLLAVYSASHEEPERFFNHLRNIIVAGFIMLMLAQIPSTWLQKVAIPLYGLGLVLLLAVALFGDT